MEFNCGNVNMPEVFGHSSPLTVDYGLQWNAEFQKARGVQKDTAVQTTLRGDLKLEPFEKAVERFRKQISDAKKFREENPGAELVDDEKERKALFERIKEILGPEIYKRYIEN